MSSSILEVAITRRYSTVYINIDINLEIYLIYIINKINLESISIVIVIYRKVA